MKKSKAQKDEMIMILKELHLPTIRECYSQEAERARSESLGYEDYLQEVLEREMESRRANRISRFLRESKLPLEKNIDTFERTGSRG